MKKVQAYKSNDGAIHESKKEALERDKQLRIKEAISKLCEEHMAPYDNRPGEIAQSILENKEEFLKALQGKIWYADEKCDECGGSEKTGHQRLCKTLWCDECGETTDRCLC